MSKFLSQYLLLMVAATTLLTSQLLLRYGMRAAGPVTISGIGDFIVLIKMVLTTPVLFIGVVLGATTSLMWLVVLSRLNLSYAVLSFNGIYFFLILLSSILILREDVSIWQWAGAVVILAGIWLVGYGR